MTEVNAICGILHKLGKVTGLLPSCQHQWNTKDSFKGDQEGLRLQYVRVVGNFTQYIA